MFRALRLFFTIFGVVSFIFWSGLGYAWMSDSYGIRTAAVAIVKIVKTTTSAVDVSTTATTTSVDANPSQNNATSTMMSVEQKTVLESAGINVQALPTSLTPKQQACVSEKIGQERMDEIATGATPTPVEVIAGASCL